MIKKTNIIQILFGIIIIIFILSKMDYIRVLEVLKQADIKFILLAFLMYILNNIIMSWRLHIALRTFGSVIRLKYVFWAHMAGMIASDITPARSGYMYTIVPLKKKNIPIKTTTSSILYCYLFDLILKVVISAVAVAYLFNAISMADELKNLFVSAFLFLILLILIIIFSLRSQFVYKLMSLLNITNSKTEDIQNIHISDLNSKIPVFVSISLIGWGLWGLEWLFIGKSIGLDIGLMLSLLLNPLITSLSMFPFSAAGLGIQEFGLSQTLSMLGFSAESGIAFAFILRFISFFTDTIGLKDILGSSDQDLK